MLPLPDAPGADLAVRAVLPEVITAVRRAGKAVLVSPPGSGKTSLLPLALADVLDGRILVAEPRRIATRAAARRLAELIGEQPGGRIGYAMRGERVGGPGVRVEVVTTGLLVQRMQRDPDLPGVGAVVLDECHERHLDADLLLAFCLDVRATLRADLVLVATSATPDTAALSRALDTPVITATAATYPVEIVWAPASAARPVALLPGARVDPRLLDHVADVTRHALASCAGDVLVFVPGEREIAAVGRALAGVDADVRPLYGRQSRAEQDLALTPGPRRRIVVTTSVAESSLTVPGVRVVVDAGLAREPRTDQARGLATLITTRVSKAAADQRAGRAGREAPGRVLRCWSAHEHSHLAAHQLPEIATADLAGFALATAAWGAPGGSGLTLLDAPPVAALGAATALLHRLGATDAGGRITGRGRRMLAVGAHPRLARAVLDGAELVGAERARGVVALLSDESLTGRGDDLGARYRELRENHDPDAARRWTQEARRLGSAGPARTAMSDDLAVGTVVALAYPDRIARARGVDTTAYQMTGGTGAQLADSSPLRGAPWLAIAGADRQPGRADARVRTAAPIDEPTARTVAADLLSTTDQVDWTAGTLVARRLESLGAIELSSAALRSPDPLSVRAAVAHGLRADGLDTLAWTDAARKLRARLGFLNAVLGDPWPAVDDAALLDRLDDWLDVTVVRRTADLRRIDVHAALRRLLPWPAATRFDELAPQRLQVPSGARVRVTYDGAQPPVVAVKLQETFGWARTPSLADGRVPVVVHLLSPAGRPVAITADLASFWRQGYPQVRAELRARYPRHPWPEDPSTAEATGRTTRPR